MSVFVYVVQRGQEGRIDKFLARHFPDTSRKRLAELFTRGAVRVEGKRVKKGTIIREGQQVKLAHSPSRDHDFRVCPEERPLHLLHEDQDIVVVNKSAGMPTYPLTCGEIGTVANRLVAQYPECAFVGNDPREAGFAHRLDRDTTGVLIAARNQRSWTTLRHNLAAGKITKHYLAAVHGRPIGTVCEAPLQQRGKRVYVNAAGLYAHTRWSEVARSTDFTLLRCIAQTGRMHQIRAHLAACGSPIAGDVLYGGTEQLGIVGHFLHAITLHFTHPKTQTVMDVAGALPSSRVDWLAAHSLDF